ncbi:ABC transporter G family member 23 [Frankliniella fusca]|uniref:ABC transporter G family member 23 n=1 Tax=Frankliniella fusca TaxID=407009 RepID=A0AAE1H0C8_9NEOP|nr:ABC transporter G family member 23 [Frankliniella fusca]
MVKCSQLDARSGGDGFLLCAQLIAATMDAARSACSPPAPADAAATPPAPSSGGPITAAVVVRGARKCYAANKWVLDGLDLTVPEASIYALLGASGCGKTTLLTCILGLRNLNAGAVKVMGVRPGTKNAGIPGPLIGYMPQELALSENFSIGETLTYFGRVAGLTADRIRARSDELLKFLEIPAKKSRLLSDLSGGQRQRVSLAVTLLHAPPLLILDEPTVGVDPILRQSIWDFLVELTRTSRTTVIITTHYIEEARQASLVGLMRRGRLLDEERPDRMMAKHNCKSLEDVFLSLSMKQDGPSEAGGGGGGGPGAGGGGEHELQPLPQGPTPFSQVKYVDVKPIPFTPHSNILACMWRAWLYIRRYKGVTAYVFMMPVLVLVLFMFTIGRDPHGLHLAVINEDANCPSAWTGYPPNCETDLVRGLSCRYLSLLQQDHDWVMEPFTDLDAARRAVQVNDVWGMIHFHANFSRHMTLRQVLFQDAETDDIDGAQVGVHLDMSNQYIGNLVRNALFRAALLFHDDMQQGCGLNSRFSAVPIDEMEPIYGDKEPSFQDFALPGVLQCVMYFPAIFYATANFMEDKLTGVMNRAGAAGVTQFEILAARAILDVCMNAAVTALVLFTAFVAMGFSNGGSYLTLTALLYVQGLCGLWVGYFVAAVCNDHYAATFFGMGIFLATTFLSGMLWPGEGMHVLLKWLAPLTPMRLSVEAVRTVLYQGSSVLVVGCGFLVTGGWVVILFAATLLIIRRQNKTG